MNLRKHLTHLGFRLSRPGAIEKMNFAESLDSMTSSELKSYQRERLSDLLLHAVETVPYYQEILKESDVVVDGVVNLSNFTQVPPLTKSVIRNQGERLHSSNPNSGVYTNTSGGTTGEPVEFLQDDVTLEWGNANRKYYHEMAGRNLGEPWIKLWGSERDLVDERASIKDRISDFLLNRHYLSSYQMGYADMQDHVAAINEIEPADVEAYVESIYELSKFIRDNDLGVHSPNAILSTAGTLTEPMREVIEDTFEAPVLNKYGSREVGTVACECPKQEGLHVFTHTHYVEIVDDNGEPVDPGEEGKLVITPLTNYTMPLIRYEIGDMAVKSESGCSCELPFPTIESVTGRVTDHFVTTDGELVYPGYLRKQLYHEPWVKKYQIHQTKTDLVVYRVVLSDGMPSQEVIDTVRRKTQSLLGEEMTVEFEYVDQIEASESGKFRYTISDVVE